MSDNTIYFKIILYADDTNIFVIADDRMEGIKKANKILHFFYQDKLYLPINIIHNQ